MYNKDTIRTEEKEMIETRCRGRPLKRKSQQFITQMYNVDTIIQEVRDCERNEMPRTALQIKYPAIFEKDI